MSAIIRRVLVYAAVGLVGPAARAGDAAAADGRAGSDTRFYLATRSLPGYVERGARSAALWSAVQSFYRSRDYRLAWLSNGRMSPEAEGVARLVARAETEGLDGRRYCLDPEGPLAVAAS